MNQIKNKTTYIAGPMTGIKDFNFPAFFLMEDRLRDMGVEDILNPASNSKDPNTTSWKEFMIDAIEMVMKSEQIVFLDGWQKSNGAKVEHALASGLGLNIAYESSGINKEEETVLQEADRIVSHDRQDEYGHPLEDFSRTAQMWSAILGSKVEPEQIGMCMIAIKLSRLCNAYKRDSVVDIAGYAKTINMVMDKKKELMLK